MTACVVQRAVLPYSTTYYILKERSLATGLRVHEIEQPDKNQGRLSTPMSHNLIRQQCFVVPFCVDLQDLVVGAAEDLQRENFPYRLPLDLLILEKMWEPEPNHVYYVCVRFGQNRRWLFR